MPFLCISGLKLDELQKKEMEREAAKHGLGVITAAIFLAGEMAGSGVLALPYAMIGTGEDKGCSCELRRVYVVINGLTGQGICYFV